LHIKAAVEWNKAEKPKPKNGAYDPDGSRFDYHSHQYDDYDPKSKSFYRRLFPKSFAESFRWLGVQAKNHGVEKNIVMPIPHVNIKKIRSVTEHPLGTYYEDSYISFTKFYNTDKACEHATLKANAAGGYGLLTSAFTGIKTTTGNANENAWKKLVDEVTAYAKESAKNVALRRLQEQKNKENPYKIGVVFGELTVNKIALPQKLLVGHDVEGEDCLGKTEKLLLAVYRGAQEGISEVIRDKKISDHVSTQIRIVLHCDTDEGTKVKGVNIVRKKRETFLGELDKKQNRITVPRDQPTITEDVIEMGKSLDQALRLDKVFSPVTMVGSENIKFENTLQLAHLGGVSVQNYDDSDYRTNALYKLFRAARDFKNKALRIVTDTSWLTAAARYANRGMGNFFKKMAGDVRPRERLDEVMHDVGDLMFSADNISNNGFMSFSKAERFFANRIASGDNSQDTVLGMALVRATLVKTFRSYYKQLGVIRDHFVDNPELGAHMMRKIKADAKGETLTEGNFIGLLYKLYNEHKDGKLGEDFDAVPFVWGSDGLTQYKERSGAEKCKLYRDQLVVESVMMMMIESLKDSKDAEAMEDAKSLKEILRQLRVGQDKDRMLFEPEPGSEPDHVDGGEGDLVVLRTQEIQGAERQTVPSAAEVRYQDPDIRAASIHRTFGRAAPANVQLLNARGRRTS